jgi:hypothetical protein
MYNLRKIVLKCFLNNFKIVFRHFRKTLLCLKIPSMSNFCQIHWTNAQTWGGVIKKDPTVGINGATTP